MKTVRELMHYPVITVGPNDSLRQVVHLMNEHHIRHVPVVDDGHLIGIVTDRDVRLHVIFLEDRFENADSFNSALDAPADGVMTRDVWVLRPEHTVDEAAALMISEKFGGAPVVEGESKLVGIVTYIDLLAELRRLVNHRH
ncbi:MAG: CBS domain-containing protein [Bryobacterales bacterium]|nr:CBS domain-containing protein [Bryobacterales bacterium]